jgi:hypothetical protein
MSARTGFGLILVLALGCGSSARYVPVSGKVTLNGQPLANAIVSFEPIGSPDESMNNPALASSGKTNANGEYTLQTTKGANGAWVGKHRVKFSVVGPDTDERPSRSRQRITLPGRYTDGSKEEFEVLSGGTDKADFALTSP